MWNELKIEKELQISLITDFGDDKGKEYYSNYTSARNYIIDHILPEIKAAEPNLTCHDGEHIRNVLQNAHFLLKDEGMSKLTSLEKYCLCLIIFFHDVGNVEGRKNHYDKTRIAKIYNRIRGNNSRFNQERYLVINAASAHSGETSTGSLDTIKEIDQSPTNLDGFPIRLRELASIVRFADELAEGPQRTSDYKNKTGGYDESSKPFHQYSEITNIQIDREGNRIALTYHIDFNSNKDNPEIWDQLKSLLELAYIRIIKLDEERRYAKYYSELLSPFKRTEVIFNFFNEGIPCEVEIEKIVLGSEYVIPRKDYKCEEISDQYPKMLVETVITKIKENLLEIKNRYQS